MSIEGHWTVRFGSVAGERVQRESGGVVTLQGGRLVGGDTWSYYSGAYHISDRQLTLRIEVSVHFFEGGESILGGPLVPYMLVGNAELSEDERRMTAAVHVDGHENAAIVAILSKVVDLP